jgi:hypothetical protein
VWSMAMGLDWASGTASIRGNAIGTSAPRIRRAQHRFGVASFGFAESSSPFAKNVNEPDEG